MYAEPLCAVEDEYDESYVLEDILKLQQFFNKSVVLVVSCYSKTGAWTPTHIHTYT